jgi:sec-independent protein translocase protein TatC
MSDNPASPAKPLWDHVAELRRRLIWCLLGVVVASGLSYVFVQDIYGFLVKPLAHVMGPDDSQRLIYTSLTEAFFTYLRVAIFAGALLSCPLILTQIWKFIAPGLYQHERRAFLPFLVATPILFFAGAACAYYIVLPLAWKFFLSFQSTGAETVLPIVLEAKVSDYLDIIMFMMFAFGLAFQLPIIMGLLAKAGLVDGAWLQKNRRYAIVLMFLASGVLTPSPDILSQISLAVPLMILYEISILLVKKLQPTASAPHHDL